MTSVAPLLTLDTSRSRCSSSLFVAAVAELKPALVNLRAAAQDHRYRSPGAALALPDDPALPNRVTAAVASLKSARLKLVFVVGIGGSNLGAQAVADALQGRAEWRVSPPHPQLFFVDTTEPVLLSAARAASETLAAPEEVALLMVSKSGTTTETVANAAVLLEALTAKFPGRAASRVLAITDEDSALWRLASSEGWARLPIPAAVGGRFSVLSAVGLVPLALAGIDVAAFRSGATVTRDQCLALDPANPAVQSATVLAHHVAEGRRLHDTFVFRPQLETWGKWYRQLAGESLGKEQDRDGATTAVGFTPTVSVGSADLHAVAQRYLTGPDESVTTFVTARNGQVPTVPAGSVARLVPDLANRSSRQLLDAILEGTGGAYEARGKPFLRATVAKLDAAGLGALIAWKEVEVLLLAERWNLNAFDQPAVEEYKRLTRQRLARR